MPHPGSDFRPALTSPTVVRLAGALLPLALRGRAVQAVQIADDDLARLRALRHERVVLTPNHPTNTDPALMFALSRRAGIDFNYLCCREAFDGWSGLWGALIQRLGAYSVVRGTIDRASFRYTRELLARPAAKLVIFPEGEVYSQNDSLLPFQMGAVQLAVWGREEARTREPDARLFLLPCALSYRFVSDVRPALGAKLARLEHKLRLAPGPTDVYARMRRVAILVLEAVERDYGLSPGDGADADLTPRLEAAKAAALARAAQLLNAKVPARGTLPERMRALLYEAERRLDLEGEESEAAPSEAPLAPLPSGEEVRRARHDLQRLANWIAIHDGYVAREPTPEHIAEVLYRLEVDAFGQASYPASRVATVRVGEPWLLPESVGRRELPELVLQLEQKVQALLDPEPGQAPGGAVIQ